MIGIPKHRLAMCSAVLNLLGAFLVFLSNEDIRNLRKARKILGSK